MNLTNIFMKASAEIDRKMEVSAAKVKRRELINIERQKIMSAHSS